MRGIREFEGYHSGEPALILGNGPSLSKWYPVLPELSAFSYRTFGTNLSWKPPVDRADLPEFRCDYHAIINGALIREHLNHHDPPKWKQFLFIAACHKHHVKRRSDVVFVPNVSRSSTWRWDLHRGTDAQFTGLMALQLSVYMGCSRIYLLGFDAHPREAHHYGGEAPRWRAKQQIRAREFHVKDMERVATALRKTNIQVYNANPESAITAFPHSEPE